MDLQYEVFIPLEIVVMATDGARYLVNPFSAIITGDDFFAAKSGGAVSTARKPLLVLCSSFKYFNSFLLTGKQKVFDENCAIEVYIFHAHCNPCV